MRRALRLAMAAALVAAASLCTADDGRLDVPFVPQGEQLCGGAAAAMVMRYWGAHGVYAEAFSALVDRSAGGIRTASLVSDLQRRGWTAVASSGDLASLRRELDRRRPVIALIEVRPSRYHYVVVIGVTADRVLLDDPARGPGRSMSTQSFASAWVKSDRWMLLILPSPGSNLDFFTGPPMKKSPSDAAVSGGGRCGVEAAVRLANAGDRVGARDALERATSTCGTDAAPWRELAGLDALDAHWDAAAAHARHAVEIDPGDGHAWRTLATAEYLRHRDAAALDAWNQLGEPLVDLVDVKGLRDTRYTVVTDSMGVAPPQILTADALRLAERRARDIPSIAAAHVTFHPVENGRAQVDAAVVERDRAPLRYPSWIALGLTAAANRDIQASLANPTGGGDLITGTWRWWDHRPLLAVSYAAPAPRRLGGGVWRVEGSRETQTFAPGSGETSAGAISGETRTGASFDETRTRASLEITRWVTARTHVAGTIGVDSWSDRRRTPFLSAAAEFWPVTDRLSIDAAATAWTGVSSFDTASMTIHWRSSTTTSGFVWLAGSGYRFASSRAPAFVWPGADTGHARDVLLRAHPLLEDGIIMAASSDSRRTGVFGRRLAFANAEVQRWQSAGKWPIRFAPAAFLDTARAGRAFGGAPPPIEVDAGAGMRLSILGLGVLRVDAAHGLRDGRNALSIGFVR